MKTQTREINCAKVTRVWPDDAKKTDRVLDKIKKLIRGTAKEIAKHKIVTCKDSHDGHGLKKIGNVIGGSFLATEKQKPSLCKELTKLRKKGIRVLDFWRERDSWQIKVMA